MSYKSAHRLNIKFMALMMTNKIIKVCDNNSQELQKGILLSKPINYANPSLLYFRLGKIFCILYRLFFVEVITNSI